MAKEDFSVAQVAQLVRAALKESFPGTKFSVRSHTYSMGSSIYVSWIDGPTEAQVESITAMFLGSERDSQDDAKRSLTHILDGEEVKFRADCIIVSRSFSDAFMQESIEALHGSLKEAFELHKLAKPTTARYTGGELWNDHIVLDGKETNVQELLNRRLHSASKAAEVQPSATLGRIKRSDGKQQEGGGHA